jgi:hypothetical protein
MRATKAISAFEVVILCHHMKESDFMNGLTNFHQPAVENGSGKHLNLLSYNPSHYVLIVHNYAYFMLNIQR